MCCSIRPGCPRFASKKQAHKVGASAGVASMLRISAAQRRFLTDRIPPGAGSIDEQRMSTASSAQTAMSMHSNALPELPKVCVCVYARACVAGGNAIVGVKMHRYRGGAFLKRKKSQEKALTFLVHIGE